MNEPARKLPDPHAAEPSITGVTGVSGVHTKSIRLPFPRPDSIPPPLARFFPRSLPTSRLSDTQLMVGLALLAPLVGLATFATLEGLASPEVMKASLEKAAPAEAPSPGEGDERAMFVDLGDEPAPGAEVAEVIDVDADSRPDTSAAQLIARGDRFRNQGHHGRARHSYVLALRIDTDNRWAMSGMIRSHLSQGHVAKAREWSQRLRRESPRWATSYVMHGDVLARTRDLRGARAAYERALSLEPRNAEARRKLARVANPY